MRGHRHAPGLPDMAGPHTGTPTGNCIGAPMKKLHTVWIWGRWIFVMILYTCLWAVGYGLAHALNDFREEDSYSHIISMWRVK